MASPSLAFVKLFRSIDLDLDNRITKEDLYRHQSKEGFSGTFAERWLKMFDKNDDGIIELEDFCFELGMTQDEVEEQLAMTTAIKTHSARPPSPIKDDEKVEVYACEMDEYMQERTVKVVKQAAEKCEDEDDLKQYIVEGMRHHYDKQWDVEIDPLKHNAPEHQWNHMIYFRSGEHKYLISDKKKKGCGCCFLCCM